MGQLSLPGVGRGNSDWSVSESSKHIRKIQTTGIAVSGLMLHLKARKFFEDTEFKASLGWYQRWNKHHSVGLCTKATLAQHLLNDLEEQTIKFHPFVTEAPHKQKFDQLQLVFPFVFMNALSRFIDE